MKLICQAKFEQLSVTRKEGNCIFSRTVTEDRVKMLLPSISMPRRPRHVKKLAPVT